jgi:di/tricarboxylate transporter
MTIEQILSVAVLAGTVVLLVLERVRYDFVAMAGLVAAVAAGVVPMKEAFRGFSDDIVIIVASALVISAGVGRTGIAEALIRPISHRLGGTTAQVAVLVGLVALLSAFMKNIAALALFLPIAFQIARRAGTPVSALLMPMSFGALLGGVMTLIGTSPNIIVSRLRQEIVGQPFSMFDFLPVGLGLTVAGVAFLLVGWRLLPRGGESGGGRLGAGEPFRIEDYTAEIRIPPDSSFPGRQVRDVEALGEGDVSVIAIVREGAHRYIPASHWRLYADDVLIVEGPPNALRRVVERARLELVAERDLPAGMGGDLAVTEAVVTASSPMVGQSLEGLRLRERHGVNLLAVSRGGRRVAERLRKTRFQVGDLLLVQGRAEVIPEALSALGCLPLAERNLEIGRRRQVVLPLLIVAVAVLLSTLQVVPLPIAFFGAAVAMPTLGILTPKEAYEAIQWPILLLLGALIPISDALRATGATDVFAGWLAVAAGGLSPVLTTGLMLLAAMALTPFLNNAATVLVMAPIAASLAQELGVRPDPFLMAVAIGAACDFLTPIGHQCNTLVMGPGGYRFGDYWRLGLPLSALVLVLGTLLIVAVWSF